MAKTHEIIILPEKPSDVEIRRMVQEYFESEAKFYDQFNEGTEKRKRFIGKMNELIAFDLKARPIIQTLLSVGCGTGFRENEIKRLSGHDFSITGVDVSPAMCAEARKSGLEVIQSDWLASDLGDQVFDAGVYLYSIGLNPSRSSRVQELKKIAKQLKPGAPFYLDTMNLNDKNEWGPELRQIYKDKNLAQHGYELGDTFYKRIGAEKIAYYHYFEEKDAIALLEAGGFRMVSKHYIDCGRNYGELVEADEGAILFVAERMGEYEY